MNVRKFYSVIIRFVSVIRSCARTLLFHHPGGPQSVNQRKRKDTQLL